MNMYQESISKQVLKPYMALKSFYLFIYFFYLGGWSLKQTMYNDVIWCHFTAIVSQKLRKINVIRKLGDTQIITNLERLIRRNVNVKLIPVLFQWTSRALKKKKKTHIWIMNMFLAIRIKISIKPKFTPRSYLEIWTLPISFQLEEIKQQVSNY